jgi:FKBP-type peptidyl-prolyl cis-trans isomerase
MKNSIGFLFIVALGLSSCLSDNAPSGPTFEEQLKKDIAAIDLYLDSKGINAIKDSSGVRYVISAIGTGKKIKEDSALQVSYTSKILSTGALLRDTKGGYFSVTPNNANSSFGCWQLVLPKLNRGCSVTIYSPSGYAYGTFSSQDGTLPSNSNLIFDLKTFDEAAFDKVAQFKIDTTAIETYLEANSIKAQIDPSGLRYVITTLGTGTKPSSTSTITFNYEGKFLSGGTFDKSTSPATSGLSNLIKGFQIGMPLLPVGSKATFYIPSSLGYGPYGSAGKIPGSANLIFDVELVSFN